MGIFALALLAHAILATRNWTAGFMPGHEFRQAQTAIIAEYIDRQDNFSLLYETPVLGKPWVGLLLEVPVYEWSVVGLSRAAGLPRYQAARCVSLACFYLTLPALFLLLGELGLPAPRRLLVLSLLLVTPVYIFYSRAFLMESMELMCCAWFLWGYLRMMERRRWMWFAVTAAAGTGAALIKSATFAVWLLPAAGVVVWRLWRELRSGAGWRTWAETVFWGLAGVTVPLGALQLWIGLTDPIKAAHASAWIFTARNLSAGNWGLVDFVARFSARTWAVLAQRWQEAIMPPWLIGAWLLAGLVFFPVVRRFVLGLAAVFFLAQLLFPFAYAYQDYYFYACAVFLIGAFGFVLHAMLDSPLPRWAGGLLIIAAFAAPLATYWQGYRPQQLVRSDGGFSFTQALRELVPRESVIIVAGADWAAMIPLYSGHRALMIRNGLENDAAYLQRAFADLADEDVAALVLVEGQRQNRALIGRAAAEFNLDAEPTFSQRVADVFCNRRYRQQVRKELLARGNYGDMTLGPELPPANRPEEPFRVSAGLARAVFRPVSPAPCRAHFRFGLAIYPAGDAGVLDAHPDSDLWLHAPAAASRIEWDFGILPNAYQREGDRTDGVEFSITGVLPGGGLRRIYTRILDPVANPADRGRQRAIVSYQPVPGELLQFSTRPRINYSYDWAYWARIEVR